jgi:2,4-dienoyl-CoA reductase-like NADH-dependent reductase (Old Yellow Enzyme family)
VSDTLSSPLRLGSSTIRNRVYRAPVLEGAGSGPDAAETYAKSFVPNARHGVGLIIHGSACLYEEGRTSPGMTLVHSRERMLAMTDMVRTVHHAGAAIFLQIGHGGIYAMEGWDEPYASERKGPLLASSPVPLMLRPRNLHALCQSSNMCVPAQMLGMKGVCYNPKVKKRQP